MLRRVHFGEGKYQEMVFFPDENFAPEVRERGVAASNRRTIRTNAAADRVGETM
jgi:hypothetical protein